MIGYYLVAGAVFVLWASSKRPTSRPTSTPSSGSTWSRSDIVEYVENMTVVAGYSERLAHALVVNAWHESRLDPSAVGDGGKSVGLWQLHEDGGGAGMTVAERMDVPTSLDRILELVDDEPAIRTADEAGAGVDELAGLFAALVERCRGCGCAECGGDDEQSAREATARAWYPDEVSP